MNESACKSKHLILVIYFDGFGNGKLVINIYIIYCKLVQIFLIRFKKMA